MREGPLDLEIKMVFTHGMSPRDPSLVRAIEAVGSSQELARKLGITPQALSQWLRVPPLRVLDVERASGVSRHDLRPDIYPVASVQTACGSDCAEAAA